MAHSGSRRGAANLGIPLMIVAFLAVAAFLWWLSVTAQGTEVPDATVEDTAQTGPVAKQVQLMDLQQKPDSLVGQDVTVNGAEVASQLGKQAFWINLPNKNPFLVTLGPQLVRDSIQVKNQQTVNVTGTVQAMSDSVLNTWVADSVITEGQRLEAEFATYFIEAHRLKVQAPQAGAKAPQAGAGSGGD